MLISARRPDGRRRWPALALMPLFSLSAAAALAHMQAKPIEQWGPFSPETVTCLRLMSRATHACFATVLGLEVRCHDALLRGDQCDTLQVDTEVDAAARALRIAVSDACSEGQLTEVRYFGYADANTDLFNACVTQARAAVSATYAPSLTSVPSGTAAMCMTASAAYAGKVMLFTLERAKPVLERMAARLFDEDEKPEFIRQLRLELSATRQRWIVGLLEACPEFATVYGRSAESFLRTLTQCTDCVLSKTYVNSAATCVTQVCGNGIKEDDEQCDDGNADDADACRSNCTMNPSAQGA